MGKRWTREPCTLSLPGRVGNGDGGLDVDAVRGARMGLGRVAPENSDKGNTKPPAHRAVLYFLETSLILQRFGNHSTSYVKYASFRLSALCLAWSGRRRSCPFGLQVSMAA